MNPTGGEPLTADAPSESSARRTFLIMCLAFGANHATVTVPIGYATSILGRQVGNASNATLYGVCMLASLFAGPLSVGIMGPKKALVFGMILYTIYVFCFALAATIAGGLGDGTPEATPLSWVVAIGGSILGGVGAGSLWTAQGAFFGAIAEQISDASGVVLQTITAQLAATFAVWFLGQEAGWKVLFTFLTNGQYGAGINSVIMIFVYAGLAGVSAVLLQLLGNDARPKNAANAPISAKAKAAVGMWSDPKIWLLSGSNLTFGFAAAYLNGYINGTWQAQALDPTFIGFLGAIIALIATFSSKIYGIVAEKLGTKMPIFVLGSLCFLANSFMSFIQAPEGCLTDVVEGSPYYNKDDTPHNFTTGRNADGGCNDGYHPVNLGPGGWGWGIVIFYVFQGLGRGVYESTNKGIFADFFPGEKSVGAFANCILQNTFASTITFLMGSFGFGKQEVWFVLIGSAATVPMLFMATVLDRNSRVDASDQDKPPITGH